MAKIEEGKYYVDGEGFYKCLEIITEEITMKKRAVMAAVITSDFHVTRYKRAAYMLDACERRMVECSAEDYKHALEQAECFISKMYEFNTKVFKPLWENKDSNND